MKSSALFLVCFLFFTSSFAQNKKQNFGLIHHTVDDSKHGRINFYITDSLISRMKPLILYLDGSGDSPLFTFKRNASGGYDKFSSIPFDYRSLASRYHVVFIGKPNVPLSDTSENTTEVKPNETYNQLLSAEWRTSAAMKALDFVLSKYSVDSSRIVAFGFSEGGQVAPMLSAADKRITHCIAFVSGGLNQLFNLIIDNRTAAQKGLISQQQAQENIDSLFNDFERIYRNPNSTQDYWYGHTYKRWSSFCSTPTIDYLTRLNIPIYMAQGTNDESTSVLSADYVRLEFLRLGKRNLTLRNYHNCDHMFNRALATDETKNESILDYAIFEALKWVESN